MLANRAERRTRGAKSGEAQLKTGEEVRSFSLPGGTPRPAEVYNSRISDP